VITESGQALIQEVARAAALAGFRLTHAGIPDLHWTSNDADRVHLATPGGLVRCICTSVMDFTFQVGK